MDRQKADDIITGVMYGAPGCDHDTDLGRTLMLAMLGELGLAALTDAAVVRLAQLHLAQEEAEIRRRTAEMARRQTSGLDDRLTQRDVADRHPAR